MKLYCESNSKVHQTVFVPSHVSVIDIVASEGACFSVILVLKNPTSLLQVSLFPAHKSSLNVIILTQLFGEKQCAITTHQMHDASESTSSCTLRGVLHESSQLQYKGMITITKNARLTEANQQSRFLLVGDKARAHAAPQLEIITHEVQCMHGSAISTLSDDHLVLCASRGVPLHCAQKMIIEGFFQEVLSARTIDEQNEIIGFLR